jgi:AraC-like DNA-binding protein
MPDDLAWPAAMLPQLRLAGRFALADRGFAVAYRSPAHALHLHDYPARMQLAGREIELRPGDLTLSPAGGVTAYDLPVAGHHWCVHFFPAPAVAAPAAKLPLHLRLGGRAAYAADQLAAVSRPCARAAPAAPLAAATAALGLQQFLLWAAGQAEPARSAEAEIAERAAAFIEAHLAEPLTAARIAQSVGRSQNHLAAAFRRRFGMTLPRYALQRRMEHARYLLESTDLPIGRVAERVGVADPHYFNKLVRRFLGSSPTCVRRGG